MRSTRSSAQSSFQTHERAPKRAGMSSQPKKTYWFVRKSYGWGWTPATREGWFVVLAHIVLLLVWAQVLLKGHTNEQWSVAYFVIAVFAQTGVLVLIAWRTGEPPAWRWGRKKDSGKNNQ